MKIRSIEASAFRLPNRRSFKWAGLQVELGVDPERDIRLVRTLRKELGSQVTLRLDANQGYGHAKEASRTVARLADL